MFFSAGVERTDVVDVPITKSDGGHVPGYSGWRLRCTDGDPPFGLPRFFSWTELRTRIPRRCPRTPMVARVGEHLGNVCQLHRSRIRPDAPANRARARECNGKFLR